jgi:hypothetical protein
LPNTWGHISKYMGTHFQIHGNTFPNAWGHISKYMGTHFQIHGDMLQTQKIYVQHIWGQITNTKEYLWNIIDYHAWHEGRSTLHLKQ